MESDDDQVYVPQVKSKVVPKLKQEFETMDNVVAFYNRYAREAGFSVRSHTSAMSKDNTPLMRKEYVCYNQGDSKFKRGLLHQRHYELEEDHINIEENAKTVMSLEIEDHMAKVYTRKLFYEVQEHLKESFKYKLELLRENETHCMYKVVRKNIDTCKSREFTYEKDSDFVSCSCRKWESDGLPCQHVLSYLIKIQDVDKLPIQYILKRWTKEAR
ncbi:hypothetical protein ACLB2K_026858 [Fragaria x ananassa]